MPDTPANPYASPATPAVPLSPAEEKQWAVLTHVLSIFFGALSAVVRLTAAIFGIVAARAANRGELYRYPLAIPFVR